MKLKSSGCYHHLLSISWLFEHFVRYHSDAQLDFRARKHEIKIKKNN
jgi:hypothetical protein